MPMVTYWLVRRFGRADYVQGLEAGHIRWVHSPETALRFACIGDARAWAEAQTYFGRYVLEPRKIPR